MALFWWFGERDPVDVLHWTMLQVQYSGSDSEVNNVFAFLKQVIVTLISRGKCSQVSIVFINSLF